MTPVDQDEFYPGGNCLEASIASILDLPLDALRVYGRHRWDYAAALRAREPGRAVYRHLEAQQREARRLGFTLARIDPPTSRDGVGPEESSLLFRPIGATPVGYSVASGPGPRTKPDGAPIYHSVVALNGAIVHDPHPSRAGLLEIEWFDLVVRCVPPARG